MSSPSEPVWLQAPPSAYDIVLCWYPESGATGSGPGPKLRPCLVTRVVRSPSTGMHACDVAFGTTTLKLLRRQGVDLIIQSIEELKQVGLKQPTRFDLDNMARLPWNGEFFGAYGRSTHPRIGSLTLPLVKEYAFLRLKRDSV